MDATVLRRAARRPRCKGKWGQSWSPFLFPVAQELCPASLNQQIKVVEREQNREKFFNRLQALRIEPVKQLSGLKLQFIMHRIDQLLWRVWIANHDQNVSHHWFLSLRQFINVGV
jgi:hypothetical protein